MLLLWRTDDRVVEAPVRATAVTVLPRYGLVRRLLVSACMLAGLAAAGYGDQAVVPSFNRGTAENNVAHSDLGLAGWLGCGWLLRGGCGDAGNTKRTVGDGCYCLSSCA